MRSFLCVYSVGFTLGSQVDVLLRSTFQNELRKQYKHGISKVRLIIDSAV
jgi:hypothetical protein